MGDSFGMVSTSKTRDAVVDRKGDGFAGAGDAMFVEVLCRKGSIRMGLGRKKVCEVECEVTVGRSCSETVRWKCTGRENEVKGKDGVARWSRAIWTLNAVEKSVTAEKKYWQPRSWKAKVKPHSCGARRGSNDGQKQKHSVASCEFN